jgi:hypothetical protein
VPSATEREGCMGAPSVATRLTRTRECACRVRFLLVPLPRR